MYKTLIVFSFLCLISSSSFSQKQVNWLTWEQAMEKNEVEQRKIIVDFYTEWCGWCKKMDVNTFDTDIIADYLNENYYPVKFDAERRETIIYKGKEYKYIRKGKSGYHELAAELMNGKLSFPTVVFLDEDSKIIQPIPGYQDSRTFEMIMKYFAEDYFKRVPWPKFTREFKPAPRRTLSPVDTSGGQ